MTTGHTYGDKDVRIISKERIYDGFLKFSKVKCCFKLFKGGWSSYVTRELIEKEEAVGVILYDEKNDLVGIIEQFRVGAIKSSFNAWQFEIVAGMVGRDESLEEVAKREVLEETGICVSELCPIISYLPSAGVSDEKMNLFCGYADLINKSGYFGLESENEDIKLHVWSFDEAMQGLYDGYFNSAASIIALQWLEKYRQEAALC